MRSSGAGRSRSAQHPSSTSPERVVASFDSASVLHGATVAALQGKPFPHLGNPPVAAGLIRVAGRLPWPVLREVYRRIGGSEGIATTLLPKVDMDAVAASFADAYPRRRYPAAFVGASNGALTHLAAALQVPWLPTTVLVPVGHVDDPEQADRALGFGRRHGPALLEANPGVVLHQMHDVAQDELMTARMAYFRVKWQVLPEAYQRFLAERLAPGAPVLLVEDTSRWPVVRVGERQVFQLGGVGGLTPEEYRRRHRFGALDDTAAEAEWGTEPAFAEAVRRWCAEHGHPVVTLRYDGPQQPSHPVATLLRRWTRERSEPADRLLVPSFVLGDPWQTLLSASVPFWTFFPVTTALESLAHHLEHSEPYRLLDVLMFQHGASSPGHATAEDVWRLAERHGVRARLLALRPDEVPRDIGSMGRYGAVLADLPRARTPWSPLGVEQAVEALGRIPTQAGPPLVDGGAR